MRALAALTSLVVFGFLGTQTQAGSVQAGPVQAAPHRATRSIRRSGIPQSRGKGARRAAVAGKPAARATRSAEESSARSAPTHAPRPATHAAPMLLQAGQPKTPGRRCSSLVQPPEGQACPQANDLACTGSPLQIGACMAARRGWFDGPGTGNEWTCLDAIVNEESNWNPSARNPSGAYGIPQALPATKMAQAGLDWLVDARTQLVWMYDDYLIPTFGTPCAAQAFHRAHGWW